eukprot:4022715-Pleurochrysis_carterae.AAC.2
MEKLAEGCKLEQTSRAAATAARSSSSILAFCRLMAVLLMASSLEAYQIPLVEPVLHKLHQEESFISSPNAVS